MTAYRLPLVFVLSGLTAGMCLYQTVRAEDPAVMDSLTPEQVNAFARMALDGIQKEFPNKPSNVMASADDVRSPREMHPAFYGCFDWHSSVHGHWMLVRLLKLYPDSGVAMEIRQTLEGQLTSEKMQAEARYFRSPQNRSFERMYGWAWLLQLARELHTFEDSQAQRWRQNLQPLEQTIVARLRDYLPKLSFPIRVGTHTDTAFALGMELDYARQLGDTELADLITTTARSFYLQDADYPAHYEPSGHDFFSSGFSEADLMRRVLPPDEFSVWLDGFLPGLRNDDLGSMTEPVDVTDVTDGHLVHLAGLNLSRAWTMTGVASVLRDGDARKTLLQQLSTRHVASGLRYVTSGHYEGEHWLATFAVYHLTATGLEIHRSQR